MNIKNEKTFVEIRNGQGTKEWSDASYNICRGCEHGCLYCYAKARACRFDAAVRQPGGWEKQTLNPNRSSLGAEVGPKGVVMFPTSHDITPRFVSEAVVTLKNLLRNNQVLIVSKPHLSVIKTLCAEFTDQKSKILFRFTVGSLDQELCAYWEPGAPAPIERIAALKYAYGQGYQTSVSCEPMLDDCAGIIRLVMAVAPYVSDTIWIGKMQRIPQKFNTHVPGFEKAVALVRARQADAEILRLVTALKHHSKVRWKDSIKKVMAKPASNR